jgi:hypothetical protein
MDIPCVPALFSVYSSYCDGATGLGLARTGQPEGPALPENQIQVTVPIEIAAATTQEPDRPVHPVFEPVFEKRPSSCWTSINGASPTRVAARTQFFPLLPRASEIRRRPQFDAGRALT